MGETSENDVCLRIYGVQEDIAGCEEKGQRMKEINHFELKPFSILLTGKYLNEEN